MVKKIKKHSKPADLSGLVDFISHKFDATEERFNSLEEMFKDLQGVVGVYTKRTDTYFQKMVILSH